MSRSIRVTVKVISDGWRTEAEVTKSVPMDEVALYDQIGNGLGKVLMEMDEIHEQLFHATMEYNAVVEFNRELQQRTASITSSMDYYHRELSELQCKYNKLQSQYNGAAETANAVIQAAAKHLPSDVVDDAMEMEAIADDDISCST